MSRGADSQTFSLFPSWAPPRRVPLVTIPEHPCPYLPSRVARSRGFLTNQLDPELYHDFMDAGFRRSGSLFYQPTCAGCRACKPVRIVVDRFGHSKSQRRCWRRNADLVVHPGFPDPTAEKFALYCRYLRNWHGRAEPESRQEFESFLYESPVATVEFTYRDRGGALLAVGICDVSARSLSSVYFYFDPAEARRSLGTFGVLCEIAAAWSRGIPHYYLGYFVAGCPAMSYKASFRPAEFLDTDGTWRESAGA